jgi:hypothetical protein
MTGTVTVRGARIRTGSRQHVSLIMRKMQVSGTRQIAALSRMLFGRSSEKTRPAPGSEDPAAGPGGSEVPDELGLPGRSGRPARRGQRPGSRGHGRRDYSHLDTREAAEAVCRQAVWSNRVDTLQHLAQHPRPEVREVALTAFGIQREHDLVDAGQPALALLDDLRFERAGPDPGARRSQRDRWRRSARSSTGRRCECCPTRHRPDRVWHSRGARSSPRSTRFPEPPSSAA